MQIARASSLVFLWLATGLMSCGSPVWAQAQQSGVSAPFAGDAPASAGAKAPNPQPGSLAGRNSGATPTAQKRVASRSVSSTTAKASLKTDTRTAARSAVATAPGKMAVTPATTHANATSSATAAITPNLRQNLFGPASPTGIEMGDRPARSTSLCGSGRARGLAELDVRTTAALLPEINGLQPRTICARRGVLIADYAFR